MSEFFAAFGIDWKLLLIQGVNFGLLLFVLWKFLYGPLLKIIDERREKIAEGVRTAELAAQRLAEAKAEGDRMVGTAAREAEGLVANARTKAQSKGLEIVKAAEGRADAIVSDAEARAEEAKRQALLESEREITRAAMLAAEKILKSKSA